MPETIGLGVKLSYGNATGTPAVYTTLTTGWTAIAEVTDITPPEPEADDIETTNHDNTDAHRTFQGGLVDDGEIDVTTHYDKTAYATVGGFIGVQKRFRILFSDGSGVGFEGYVKKHGTEADIEGLTTMKFSMKVSGALVFIAAAT